MKDENTVCDVPTQNEPINPPIGMWKNLWDSYQYKLRTDQSFRATVVAFQVFGFIVVFLALVFFLLQKSNAKITAHGPEVQPHAVSLYLT